MLNDTCQNVHVLNELDVPVLCMGLKDVVVSASPEGILVSDKEQSSYIKPYVDSIHQQIMFAEKSWGSFRVLDVEDASMTIKITLTPAMRPATRSGPSSPVPAMRFWTACAAT